MKNRWRAMIFALSLLLTALFFCSYGNENYERSEKMMGTIITLKASEVSAKAAVDLVRKIFEEDVKIGGVTQSS